MIQLSNQRYFLGLGLMSGLVMASSEPISEKSLLEKFRASSIGALSQNLASQSAQLQLNLSRESFRPRIVGGADYQSSNEKSLNPGEPLFSPQSNWNLGVQSALPYGVSVKTEVIGRQYSINQMNLNNATQLGIRAQAEVDLWKNFLGKLDQAKLRSHEAQQKQAQLSERLQNKLLEAEVRKIYWSLVSVQQSIELSKNLELSAQKQLKDAESRLSAGVAENGEVSRYRAQLDSRKASSLLFEYEKDLLLQALSRQMNLDTEIYSPELAQNTQAEETLIIGCIEKLNSEQQKNLSYTQYDELIDLINQEQKAEELLAKSHAAPNVSMLAQIQSSGQEYSYGDALNQWGEDFQSTRSIGIRVSIPLGDSAQKSQAALAKVKQLSASVETQQIYRNLDATHQKLSKSLSLLRRGLETQQQNSQNLSRSYQDMLSKFRQGRVGVSNLILEQDALFQSQLQEINLKKQVTHLLLDYLAIYNDYPCEWNQI